MAHVRVYYCPGKDFIPSESQLVASFDRSEFLKMASAFKALANWSGSKDSFALDEELFLPPRAVESLVSAVDNVIDKERDESKRSALERLSEIARGARLRSTGIAFMMRA